MSASAYLAQSSGQSGESDRLEAQARGAQVMLHLLREQLGQGPRRVADLGCGPGALMLPLAGKRFESVVAIDIDEHALARAKKCGTRLGLVVETVRADLTADNVEQALPARELRAVISAHTVNHIGLPALLRAARHLLGPGPGGFMAATDISYAESLVSGSRVLNSLASEVRGLIVHSALDLERRRELCGRAGFELVTDAKTKEYVRGERILPFFRFIQTMGTDSTSMRLKAQLETLRTSHDLSTARLMKVVRHFVAEKREA